jgi:hypothetical protein
LQDDAPPIRGVAGEAGSHNIREQEDADSS